MRYPLLLITIAFLGICSRGRAQVADSTYRNGPYFQQQANFSIQVTLNDRDNTLDGFEKIEYTNHSPDTLTYIWFHVWPNAYKNDKTMFSDQLLENGNTKFYFSGQDDKGYINRLDFKVNNVTASTEDHPTHIDIIKLVLPSPLAPGAKTIITTPFHVKLPYNISRGGHDGQSYQATQWFPKPAVYDRDGWHPMTYLDQGEFYSEFGSYDVSITVPSNYVVAATGVMDRDAAEEAFIKERSSYTWKPVVIKEKNKTGQSKKSTQLYPPSSVSLKTLRFRQDNIHDFAWFADKRFIVKQDTCLLASGKVIGVNIYYTSAHALEWSEVMRYAKRGLRYYSNRIGDYPYPECSVVQGPESFGSGMEYPMITSIAPLTGSELELTTVHEIGHNWFEAALGTNERANPWMDEGFNTYYEREYARVHQIKLPMWDGTDFRNKAAEKLDQPISTGSEEMSASNYEMVTYYKTSVWLKWVETQLGTSRFDDAMRHYYTEWKFQHPSRADFRVALNPSGDGALRLDSSFALLDKKGLLPNQPMPTGRLGVRSGLAKPGNGYTIMQAYQNTIIGFPVAGLNNYDKLMPGVLVTNYNLPPGGLQFMAIPLYSIGAKKLAGLGVVSYSIFPDNYFQRIDIGLAGSMFSINKFVDEDGNKTFLRVKKLVPGIKLIKKERYPRSTAQSFVQFKTYLFGEDKLGFRRDSIFTGMDTIVKNRYSAVNSFRYLNQLKLVTANYRVLYPYRAELKIEQAQDFVRAAFTGNYFFNYAKAGGLDVRFFAGKFFYLGEKTVTKQFANDRYHLNMSGPGGNDDYTYSDYFGGRNEFDGALSQQIMIRDGAFKVRTDLLAEKVGKTDDWLMAMNLRTSIPKSINPLEVLPIKIPLKIFVDIGTYAEAWKKDANVDRFLYDAGLEIPILKETVRIYIPIFYSKIYKDYYKSLPDENTFGKRISFAIDLSNFSFRKWDPNASF